MKFTSRFSYWEKTSFLANFDVVIIGAGIVGLLTAIELKEHNKLLKIAILESNFLPTGASTKNAGFACFGSISELIDDLTTNTVENVFDLVKKRYEGLEKLKKIVPSKAMNFENLGGYEIFENKKDFLIYESEIEKFNTYMHQFLNIKNVYEVKNKVGFINCSQTIFNKYEGQLHSGNLIKYLFNLNKDLDVSIYTGIHVDSISHGTNNVTIYNNKEIVMQANKCVVTNNAFAKELLPKLNINPARGQVIISKPIPNLSLKSAYHFNKGYVYFRNIDDRILIGGGRDINFEAENTSSFKNTKQIISYLENTIQDLLPSLPFETDYYWSGIMAFGETKTPIIKQIETNLFCAVRMGGMGVALGSIAAQEVSELVIQSL